MIYNFKDIRGVHLELTTKCNSNCTMCGRNFHGIVCPKLKLTELSLKDCKRIFSPEFLRQLKNMSICGVYGEPTLAKDFLEIIEYILACNPKLKLDVYTNGGIHSIDWWQKLAQVLNNEKSKVVFGIDGLKNTHSIYRRGTKFPIILRNAQAFIRSGGIAEWNFIVFKHNEHQVKEAHKISKKLGFKIFQVKRTSRFYNYFYEQDPALVSQNEQFGKKPFYNNKGQKTGNIELPNNNYYRNDSLKTIKKLIKEYGSLIKYFDRVPIKCQAKKTGGIFVSATGSVFPCCWVYQQSNYGIFYGVRDLLELNEANALYKSGGIKFLSAKKYSIKHIINGRFFKLIEKSWDLQDLKNGKSKVCARHCGCQLDMHERQHCNSRSKVFEKKRLPYQVLVFPYFKKRGNYLYAIFKRRDLKFWQGISGGGEGNEIPLQAAKRETFEETKIDSELIQLDSGTTIPVENLGNYRWKGVLVVPEYAFGVKARSRKLEISHEHSEYRWLSYEKANRLLKYDSNKTALWELNHRLKGGGITIVKESYPFVLPIEHFYLDKLSAYPIGHGMKLASDHDKFMFVFEYFLKKGIRNFIVIGKDLWPFIPEAKKIRHEVNIVAGGGITNRNDLNILTSYGVEKIIVGTAFYKKLLKP